MGCLVYLQAIVAGHLEFAGQIGRCLETRMSCSGVEMVGVHTEHFPALAKTLAVFCIDHVCHSMTVIIVPMPYISYTALAAQVPELEDGGWERYLAHCN